MAASLLIVASAQAQETNAKTVASDNALPSTCLSGGILRKDVEAGWIDAILKGFDLASRVSVKLSGHGDLGAELQLARLNSIAEDLQARVQGRSRSKRLTFLVELVDQNPQVTANESECEDLRVSIEVHPGILITNE